MKILFLTGAYPKGAEQMLLEMGKGSPLSIPSNTFQWAVIDGLEKNNADYSVVSYPFLSCFPSHFKRLYTPKMDFIFNEHKIGSMEPFFNVTGISRYSIRKRLYKFAKKWAEQNQKEDKLVVLTYSPSSWFLEPIIRLKKSYSNITLCPIITDLPDDYINPMYNLSAVKLYLQANELKKIRKCYKDVDGYVLLSKPMEEKIPNSEGRDIIIEGISADCTGLHLKTKETEYKTLLYTGSLGIHTSIIDLVDAFMKTTNPNFRLVICGGGECEKYINECSETDSRIVFKGVVPREDVLELQRNATAVINPRKPSIPITRFSFPSKTMEYMSSGTPFVGYKLGGIPEEYYEHYYALTDESEETLINAINVILTKPLSELNAKAEDAYHFISEKKSSQYQVARLLEFLKNE